MSSRTKSASGCTIVVELSVVAAVGPAVWAATTLAAAVGAEVRGLFVEEDALIDLAGLPFSSASTPGAKRPNTLSKKLMIEAFRYHEKSTRLTLSTHAENANVSWTFVSKTGDLKRNIKAALTLGDFLVLTGDLRGFGSHLLIDQLHSSPTGTRGVVVTAHDISSLKTGPVIAIIDGFESGRESVLLAEQIARVADARFELFVIAANNTSVENIVQLIRQTLGLKTPFTARRFLPGASLPIAAALIKSSPYFVVAELGKEPFDDDKSTLEILRAARAPIVLLHPGF